MEEAIRRLSLLPAQTLGIRERGRLAPGYFADIAIFDATTINDNARFDDSHQYASGMQYVFVNGVPVVSNGEHTNAKPGRAVHGPGWTQR